MARSKKKTDKRDAPRFVWRDNDVSIEPKQKPKPPTKDKPKP